MEETGAEIVVTDEAQPASSPARAEEPTLTVVGGQRGPKKTARIELAEPYEKFWVVAWINPKRRLFRDLNSGDEERSDQALGTMIIDHNLVWSPSSDTPGEEMPKPLTYDALGDLEQDLYMMIGRGIGEAVEKMAELPKRSRG